MNKRIITLLCLCMLVWLPLHADAWSFVKHISSDDSQELPERSKKSPHQKLTMQWKTAYCPLAFTCDTHFSLNNGPPVNENFARLMPILFNAGALLAFWHCKGYSYGATLLSLSAGFYAFILVNSCVETCRALRDLDSEKAQANNLT